MVTGYWPIAVMTDAPVRSTWCFVQRIFYFPLHIFWKIASARITQAQPAPSATVATEFRDGLPSTNGFFRHNLVTLRTGGWRPLSRKASCRLV